MNKNKLREALIRFHATMRDHDYESAVAEYNEKTPNPEGDPIDSKLFTTVNATVDELLADTKKKA